MAIIDASPTVGIRKVDAYRGSTNGTVSAQWASRPDDQRFLSLHDLGAHVRHNAETRKSKIIATDEIRVIASYDDPDKLTFAGVNGHEYTSTHWSFGQACQLGGAPASYLRKLPAMLAGINLQFGLKNCREEIKLYADVESHEIIAMTSPDYGRIKDAEIVGAVERLTDQQPFWKVPGVMNWSNMTYNPYVDVTKDTTTLFASDRDIFLFLVDDTHPIEIGKLQDGSPDLVFRGFYAWNSEVGARTAGCASFFLRGVCMNRNLWGVEDFNEIRIRHTKFGPQRWAREAAPALRRYAEASPSKLLAGVTAAKQALLTDKSDRSDVLATLIEKTGMTKPTAAKVMDRAEQEEGHPPVSVWDFCQGITAVARDLPHQDARLDLEAIAGKLMKRAAR